MSLKSSATIASSSNQHWKFNIIPSKVCTASGFNKFTLALHKLSEVFFFKLLPNVFLGREHYVIECTTVSRGPWESEPSFQRSPQEYLRKCHLQFLPALTAPHTLIMGFHVTDLAACGHHNRECKLFIRSFISYVERLSSKEMSLSFLRWCLHQCPSPGLLPAGFWGACFPAWQ